MEDDAESLFGDTIDYDKEDDSFVGGFGLSEPSTLRRRVAKVPSPPPAPITPPAPLPPRRPGCWRRICDRIELWRYDFREHWWPRHSARCSMLCCRCVGLTLLLLLGSFFFAMYTSDPVAIITSVAYVRHGFDGVDLKKPSIEYSCTEIAEETTSLHTTIEQHIIDDNLLCACAPMFGIHRRYLAIASNPIIHMFNPTIDRSWTGYLDDGSKVAIDEVLVEEDQQSLFPLQHTRVIDKERLTAVRVSYRTETCGTAALVLQDDTAYCAQACDDLFDGKSVYD